VFVIKSYNETFLLGGPEALDVKKIGCCTIRAKKRIIFQISLRLSALQENEAEALRKA
jgi:hypothetical protein